MVQEPFVNCDLVKQTLRHDDKLSSAIDRARTFIPRFCDAFLTPAIRQVDFIATVFELRHGHFAPIGVAVDRIYDGVIEGSRLCNSHAPQPSGRILCNFDQVADLRFTDTFECEGGFVYKELYQRQSRMVKNWIWEKLTFLPEWDSEFKFDRQFRDFLRHIANHRHGEALQMLVREPSLASRLAYMPRPGYGKYDSRVMLMQTTAAEYAAEFGNRETILALHDVGLLEEDPGGRPPLCSSAIRGNVSATVALLELGYDIEVTDRHGHWPLNCAATWGRQDTVKLLIQRGADLNRQDNRGMTALFLADSKEIVRQLLVAGASTLFKDDQGRDCVTWHNTHGRTGIVDLLVQFGAIEPCEPAGLSDEQILARGLATVSSVDQRHRDCSPDMGCEEISDFGFILPVKVL